MRRDDELIRPHVRMLAEAVARGERRPLSQADHEVMAMNSYERWFLLHYSDDDHLLWKIKHAQGNCMQKERPHAPAGTYDEALKFDLIDELVERFDALWHDKFEPSSRVYEFRALYHTEVQEVILFERRADAVRRAALYRVMRESEKLRENHRLRNKPSFAGCQDLFNFELLAYDDWSVHEREVRRG